MPLLAALLTCRCNGAAGQSGGDAGQFNGERTLEVTIDNSLQAGRQEYGQSAMDTAARPEASHIGMASRQIKLSLAEQEQIALSLLSKRSST